MYYNGTWLWHREQGPVQVKVNFNGDFYVEDFEETVDAALLDHWFPRGGAVRAICGSQRTGPVTTL
jgi:hypothetical protein